MNICMNSSTGLYLFSNQRMLQLTQYKKDLLKACNEVECKGMSLGLMVPIQMKCCMVNALFTFLHYSHLFSKFTLLFIF